jgi:hypothetical protein
VDSNKTRKTSPNGYEQASSWRRLPTIDTDQYVALVVGNNILKFHQDRTTNETPISDGSGCEKNSIFLSFSPPNSCLSLSPLLLFFFCFSSFSFLQQPAALLQQPIPKKRKVFSHLLMLQLYRTHVAPFDFFFFFLICFLVHKGARDGGSLT